MPIDVSRLPNGSISNGRESATVSKSSEVSRISTSGAASVNVNSGGLAKGQVFSGQVTNISPGELTLELENGQTLTAKYDNSSEISIGDGARFKVVDNEDGRITLKSVHTTGTLENIVYKALEASGLPFSAKNEELITSLIKNEYPVSKQMINAMMLQSLKNPDISMANLVLMNRAGLEINPESSKLFDMYSTGRTELAVATEANFKDMLGMIEGLLSEGNTDEAVKLASDMIEIFNIGKEPDELVLSLVADKNHLPSSPDTSNIFSILDNLATEGATITYTDLLSDEGLPTKLTLTRNSIISSILNDEQRLDIFTLFENADADVDASMLQNLIKGDLNLTEFSDLLRTLPENELTKLNSLMEQLTDLTRFGEIPQNDILAGILPESATLNEAATHIKSILDNASLSPEIKQALIKSDDFNKTLKMLMYTDWTLSAEELTKKDAVNNLYRQMDEQIDKLKLLADNVSNPASAKLSADLSQTKQNMNFMNEMNQIYNFTEIPIRMNGQTTTGDLYVYSDKHKKRVADGSGISCLLHLDMASLGGMNIRIDLKDSTVSTRFFLSDDSSGKLISDHLEELDLAMTKQGFNPKSEVVKTSDKEEEKKLLSGNFNPINDFIPAETVNSNYSRYTFDVRA